MKQISSKWSLIGDPLLREHYNHNLRILCLKLKHLIVFDYHLYRGHSLTTLQFFIIMKVYYLLVFKSHISLNF